MQCKGKAKIPESPNNLTIINCWQETSHIVSQGIE